MNCKWHIAATRANGFRSAKYLRSPSVHNGDPFGASLDDLYGKQRPHLSLLSGANDFALDERNNVPVAPRRASSEEAMPQVVCRSAESSAPPSKPQSD